MLLLLLLRPPGHATSIHYPTTLTHLASPLRYINMYGCDMYGYPIGDGQGRGKCTNPKPTGWLAMVYFVVFVNIGCFVMLTLFIGVINSSMDAATRGMKDGASLAVIVDRIREAEGINEDTVKLCVLLLLLLLPRPPAHSRPSLQVPASVRHPRR